MIYPKLPNWWAEDVKTVVIDMDDTILDITSHLKKKFHFDADEQVQHFLNDPKMMAWALDKVPTLFHELPPKFEAAAFLEQLETHVRQRKVNACLFFRLPDTSSDLLRKYYNSRMSAWLKYKLSVVESPVALPHDEPIANLGNLILAKTNIDLMTITDAQRPVLVSKRQRDIAQWKSWAGTVATQGLAR